MRSKRRLFAGLFVPFSLLCAVAVANVAGSAQREPTVSERVSTGDLEARCGVLLPGQAAPQAVERAPMLPAVEGATSCPGARRVIPPGAPTSRQGESVMTRGRDGKSWTIPYTAEIVYEQLPDGTIHVSEILPGDEALLAAMAQVMTPEDLAEMRGGPKPKD